MAAAGTALSLSDDEVLRWFGRLRAIPGMVTRWPDFFAAHHRTIPFLRMLQRDDLGAAQLLTELMSAFRFHLATYGSLVIGYRSPRQLCGGWPAWLHPRRRGPLWRGPAVEHLECMQLKEADRGPMSVEEQYTHTAVYPRAHFLFHMKLIEGPRNEEQASRPPI